MKRIIAVVDNTVMNNWDVLEQGVILGNDEYEIIFHRDPKVSIIDGKIKCNFDLAVHNGDMTIDGMALENLIPGTHVHEIKRFNKIEQHSRLATAVASYSDEEPSIYTTFKPIGTWYHPQTSGFSHLVSPSGSVVIKPRDGARGIGQFLIDTDKVPLAIVVDALDKFRLEKLSGEELMAKLKQLDPDIPYATKHENDAGEGLNAIFNQGYTIQSFIPNITCEYRILTDGDCRPIYCQKRSRHEVAGGFVQATGSNSNSALGDDIVEIDQILRPHQLTGLLALARTCIGPLSSIDLFTTDDGMWGIFEYCNQFGITGVPFEVVHRLHKDFLYSLVKQAGL